MHEPTRHDDVARVAALALYEALDTPPEFAYDALTELAAQICGCPVALISLVDERRQWFKSKYGLPADFVECPREMTVCSSTICSNDLLYVPELMRDERFRDLPIVAGEPHLRFYCGMPLITRDGHALGTLCVVDFEPRELTPSQREAVRRLAQQAMAQLELRRQLCERDVLLKEVSEARAAAETERKRSDLLLRTVLPEPIADELIAQGRVEARYHESTTIVFADFKGFTRLTETLDPARLLAQLGQNFTRFEEIAQANRLETIKTIGDAYVCAGGLPTENRTHAIDACVAALQMQAFVTNANRQREKLRLASWELRIGVNTGPVVHRNPAPHLRHLGQCRERGAAHGRGLRARTREHLGEHHAPDRAAVPDRAARRRGGEAPRCDRHVFPGPHQAGIRGRCAGLRAERGVLEGERTGGP